MTTEFAQLGLMSQLDQTVSDLGYITPTPIQSEIIPLMLDGNDVIGQAQTGTGKTAAFMLPILQTLERDHCGIQALVLTPTRELAIQVAKAANEYGKRLNVRVLPVYGGQRYNLQINRLRQGVDIVVGTPGRLLDLINKKVLDLSSLRTVVLDEADEMLSMGFMEDMEEILSTLPSERQAALFSATIPPKLGRMINKYMHSPKSVTIKSKHLTVDATEHQYCLVNKEDKLAVLTRLFEIENITSAIIFVRTRVGTSDLVNELTGRGFPAEALNGDLNQQTREQVLNRFRSNQTTILVATDVAARGLDINDISHVFNYDLPEEPELYVHRVGRTGRAGKTGIAISLLATRELWRLHRIEGFTKQEITRKQIPTTEEIEEHRKTQLLEEMTTWLDRGRCRRELQMVNQLVEIGHDPLKIAAIALKMVRREEKQRPIAQISEVQEERFQNSRRRTPLSNSPTRRLQNSRRNIKSIKKRKDRNGANGFYEKGMVRLTFGAGRSHGVRPADVVGTIAYHAKFPGNTIGAISILDKHTLVDVPQQYVEQTLAKSGEYKIHKRAIKLNLA